ncbi:MAG: hypothetical protein ACI8XB_000842 [Patiriisocius sp.]|jgi:hypothetical protein
MNTLELLKNAVNNSITGLFDMMSNALPGIIGAIVVLIVFWIIAKIIKWIVKNILKKAQIDTLSEKMELDLILKKAGIKSKLSAFLSGLLYWLILLFGIIVASEIIGIPTFTLGVATIVGYLPKLAAAFIIFLLGIFISDMVKNMVLSATASIGLSGGKVIANIIYYVLLIFISITALNQTGIDTGIITSNLTLIFGSMLVAFAISYGFASKEILTNVLSSFYGKDRFKVGMTIKINGTTGTIIKIDSLSVTLKTKENTKIIPVKNLVTEEIEILDEI